MDYYYLYRSLIFWTNMCMLFKDFRIDVCSLIHSLFTGIGSHIVYENDPNLPYFALGYSVYDIYTAVKNNKKDFIIHGILYASLFFYAINRNLFSACNMALTMNTSTIFLNNLYIQKMYRYDIHYPRLFKLSSLLFVLVFIYYRLILFPINSYNYFKFNYDYLDDTSWYVLLTGSISITILNLWWVLFIIKKYLSLIYN